MSPPTPAVRHPSGFRSFPEFLNAVQVAGQTRRGVVDERLRVSAAATSSANEGTGADGGYLAPPDFAQAVSDLVMSRENLLARCVLFPTTKSSVTVPIDERSAYSTSGPQVTVQAEGSVLVQSKLAVGSRNIRLAKLSVLLPISNELVEDAGTSLETYLAAVIPERMLYLTTEYLVRGDGVTKPLGVLNSPALITIAAEGGQAAATVRIENLQKMHASLLPGLRSSAVWLVHQSVEKQLAALTGAQPGSVVYNWSPGESFARLMGLPVVVSEACSAAGTVGDILLIGCAGIAVAHRPGLIARSVSTHLYFDQGQDAYRFDLRLGASVMLSAAVTQRNGSGMLSSIVTLAARP